MNVYSTVMIMMLTQNVQTHQDHLLASVTTPLTTMAMEKRAMRTGLKDTSLQHEPSFSLLETTEDMDISKMMLTPIHSMPHTATTVMVRHSVRDMTFTLQAMQAVAIILISVVPRTPVRCVTIMDGQEIKIFVQMR